MLRYGISAHALISTLGYRVNLRFVHHVIIRALSAGTDGPWLLITFFQKSYQRFVHVLDASYIVFCWTAQGRRHIKMLRKCYSPQWKTRIHEGPSDNRIVKTQSGRRNGNGDSGVKAIKVNSLPFRFEGHESSPTYEAWNYTMALSGNLRPGTHPDSEHRGYTVLDMVRLQSGYEIGSDRKSKSQESVKVAARNGRNSH